MVATALCADRAVSAAPEVRAEGSVASRIVSRLTTGLRRAVASVRIFAERQETRSAPPLAASRIDTLPRVTVHPTFSESQFRLPPPTL